MHTQQATVELQNIRDVANALKKKNFTTNHFLAYGAAGSVRLLQKIPEIYRTKVVNKNTDEEQDVIASHIVLTPDDCAKLLEDMEVTVSQFNCCAITLYKTGNKTKLSILTAASCAKNGEIQSTACGLSDKYEFRLVNLNGRPDCVTIKDSGVDLYLPSVPNIISNHFYNTPLDPRHTWNSYHSYKYKLLQEAIRIFWTMPENFVCLPDHNAYPSRNRIIEWFVGNGISNTAAIEMESIIRPGFAGGAKEPAPKPEEASENFFANALLLPEYKDLRIGNTTHNLEQNNTSENAEKEQEFYQDVKSGDITFEKGMTHYGFTEEKAREIMYKYENNSANTTPQ